MIRDDLACEDAHDLRRPRSGEEQDEGYPEPVITNFDGAGLEQPSFHVLTRTSGEQWQGEEAVQLGSRKGTAGTQFTVLDARFHALGVGGVDVPAPLRELEDRRKVRQVLIGRLWAHRRQL